MSGDVKVIRIPETWGWCMCDGVNERAFTELLLRAVGEWKSRETREFHYLEIGLGVGDTLRAIDLILSQCGIDYRMTGVEVPGWSGAEIPERATISTLGSEEFLGSRPDPVDFAFIDGCHGFACVKRDFEMLEPWMVKGGIVAFHDTSPQCQGHHLQPHCGTGIDARAAVGRLGLLDDSRMGWTRIAETFGDMQRGVHGCLFVQKL